MSACRAFALPTVRSLLVLGSLATAADGLVVRLPAARPARGSAARVGGSPHMVLDRRPKQKFPAKFENPVKVIATVIAQADIVGYEPPKRVPDAFVAPSDVAAPDARLPNGARREVDRECV